MYYSKSRPETQITARWKAGGCNDCLLYTSISSLRQPGDKSPYEYRLLQKDGTPCWIIGSAEVLLDSDGEQIIQSVFLDIDSRKKAEQRSQRLAEQVEASNEILHLALAGTSTCEFYYYPETRECQIPEHTCQVYGLSLIHI